MSPRSPLLVHFPSKWFFFPAERTRSPAGRQQSPARPAHLFDWLLPARGAHLSFSALHPESASSRSKRIGFVPRRKLMVPPEKPPTGSFGRGLAINPAGMVLGSGRDIASAVSSATLWISRIFFTEYQWYVWSTPGRSKGLPNKCPRIQIVVPCSAQRPPSPPEFSIALSRGPTNHGRWDCSSSRPCWKHSRRRKFRRKRYRMNPFYCISIAQRYRRGSRSARGHPCARRSGEASGRRGSR